MSEPLNYSIQFYVSIVAYFILHMIFVISSDFVEAFNIPPLNIGIYVDKLAAIRALLMVIADILEWGCLDQAAGDHGKAQHKLTGGGYGSWPNNPRRLGSILSFVAMLGCRIVYLWLIYESDNKSLSVFIVLCIEGFWFGVFQMSFFAIGPKYNAATSLGIHTMGNFIFFLQLFLNKLGKTRPKINSLYRVRVHGWICLISSLGAFGAWLYFCIDVDATGDLKNIAKQLQAASVTIAIDDSNVPVGKGSVWSPFWLFIVGAFAEDFSVPGILPFAFLDPEKANLVNYLTPLFFMTGALVTFFLNDVFGGQAGFIESVNSEFKEWSASANANKGQGWHGLWVVNVPKYIAFFISMWSIHGTYGRLRCIVQSRWRVLVLTMLVVVPRAWLETAGYVGVANYAIGLFAVTGWNEVESKQTESPSDEKKKWANSINNPNGTHKGNMANASGFMYIAFHDMVAMFCRFVYGKFAVGYNLMVVSSRILLDIYLDLFNQLIIIFGMFIKQFHNIFSFLNSIPNNSKQIQIFKGFDNDNKTKFIKINSNLSFI